MWDVGSGIRGARRASNSAGRMKGGPKLGLSILLATLLLLNVTGLCAAMVVNTNQPVHPCCPKNPPPSKSSTDCCMLSAIPVEPTAVSIRETTGSADWPVDVNWPTRREYSHPKAPAVTSDSGTEPRFIRFHQFLI